jgi:uncharacterized membrane protein
LVIRDCGRIFPGAGRIFSRLCGAPLLAEITILGILRFVTIGLVWASIGVLLLGNYYRGYENKLRHFAWVLDRPTLNGSIGLALEIALYVCWIVLSKTFSRC